MQDQAQLPPDGSAAGSANQDLDRILDIPLTVHVELGRKRLRISELLQVGTGAILELDNAAGSPLSIYANNTLIAQGEAVVVGDLQGVDQRGGRALSVFLNINALGASSGTRILKGARDGETFSFLEIETRGIGIILLLGGIVTIDGGRSIRASGCCAGSTFDGIRASSEEKNRN